MTGALIEAEFDDAKLRAAIGRLSALAKRPGGLLRAIGVALVANTERRFATGRGPDGQAWHPLLPAYAAIKRGNHILIASGQLRNSITRSVEGTSLLIGTNRIYAGVHQFGAVIRPRSAPALAFFLGGVTTTKVGRGGKTKTTTARELVRVKSVTIPARPYLGIGPEDREDIAMEVNSAIRRAIA